ncbi:MAG: alkaline phosphatase D family protein [Balneolales bacterium]
MDRKEYIKTIFLGTLSLPHLKESNFHKKMDAGRKTLNTGPMRSRWMEWPDMPWVGPGFWGNRLQDWQIYEGKAVCVYSGPNRNLHCLTHQLNGDTDDFITSVEIEFLNKTGHGNDYCGFRFGARAKENPCPVTFVDYRRSAVYGQGMDVGVTADERLFIGEHRGPELPDFPEAVRLEVKGLSTARTYRLELTARDAVTGRQLGRLTSEDVDPENFTGNIALVSHFPSQASGSDRASSRFANWQLSGSKVISHSGQVYGPILFSQYTLDRRILKLTAQLAPVETITGHKVSMQIREKGRWKTLQETTVHPLARTAQFRFDKWPYNEDRPYRIRLELPLTGKTEEFFYEGTIAADPVSVNEIKAAVFSCNQEHGFPDTEVVRNVAKHRPQMAMFLGDQFYESFGGFGVERSHDLENSTLDYLRKWYMFGWSYRDVFRHIPSVFIPDDHDMFQGNIWGQEGKPANIENGFAPEGQDTGGFTMLPEWVKMVERTQTSHLPDPYDPTPVDQGIGVYYTDWNYGGISFAILEDRKFKTAPGNAFPPEAGVRNGFIQNTEFDSTGHYELEPQLLGERQHRFLEEWSADWSQGAQLKVVLSQSPFCGAHTLPYGETSDTIVPRRPVPERGESPAGDSPAKDMDTNGWPPQERNKALRIIRKSFALHVAGDQHLASTIQYGVDEYQDAGFVFTLPALNNTWPRRWWPTVGKDHRSLPGQPAYTGNFQDAFGNCMTILAVANPVKTNRVPAIIYDRATGYGMLVFDKSKRSTRLECWPRYIDPVVNPEGQYGGWPLTIRQEDSYGRQARGFLPEFEVTGLTDPVIQIFDQRTGELEYALRINGQSYRPGIFHDGLYKVRIGDPDLDKWCEFEDLSPDQDEDRIACDFT